MKDASSAARGSELLYGRPQCRRRELRLGTRVHGRGLRAAPGHVRSQGEGKVRIALDCDGVLANLADPVHEAAERILERKLPTPGQWTSYDFDEAMGLSFTENNYLLDFLEIEDDLGFKVDLYPGAEQFVIDLMAAGHDVFFCTTPWAGIRSWVWSRTNLLVDYFGPCDIVFANNKSRVSCDLIVDDKPETLQQFGPRAIAFSQTWNQGLPGIRRAFSYEHCLQLIKETK